jgi:hypothetical protein
VVEYYVMELDEWWRKKKAVEKKVVEIAEWGKKVWEMSQAHENQYRITSIIKPQLCLSKWKLFLILDVTTTNSNSIFKEPTFGDFNYSGPTVE